MHFLFVYLQINICRFTHVSCKPNKYSTCIRLVSNNKIVWFLSSIKRWKKNILFFPFHTEKNGANNRASRTHCYRYTCRSFAHKIQWKYLHFFNLSSKTTYLCEQRFKGTDVMSEPNIFKEWKLFCSNDPDYRDMSSR